MSGEGVVEDVTTVITQAVGYDEHVEAFQRVDDVNILVDLVVGRSRRARKNTVVVLPNLVKSNGENAMGTSRKWTGQRWL